MSGSSLTSATVTVSNSILSDLVQLWGGSDCAFTEQDRASISPKYKYVCHGKHGNYESIMLKAVPLLRYKDNPASQRLTCHIVSNLTKIFG